MPEHIAFLLHALGILLDYGHHLLATVRRRATTPTFTTIASGFGTANLTTILAHLNRGILRAAALERLLLARAATGRDITISTPRTRTAETPQSGALPEPPADQPAAPRPSSRPTGWHEPKPFMPTPEDLELQVRRRSLGRTFVDICVDLAVVPGLCTAPFWNHVFEIMHCLGGSVASLMREKTRRADAFAQQPESSPESNWDWRDLRREVVRQVLGFFIGEEPVDPFVLSPTPCAPATGPP